MMFDDLLNPRYEYRVNKEHWMHKTAVTIEFLMQAACYVLLMAVLLALAMISIAGAWSIAWFILGH